MVLVVLVALVMTGIRHMARRAVSMAFFLAAFGSLGDPPKPAVRTSLLKLIASPEATDGRRVMSEGYLVLEQEGDALYVAEADFVHGLTLNAVYLHLTEQERAAYAALNKKYVTVIGVHRPKNRGHMSIFSGSLRLEKLWAHTERD